MSNSRVISCDFDYYSPATLDEALSALKTGAQVLAGGTDLLNDIKTAGLEPRALVYVLGIEELEFIRFNGRSDGGLHIGAAARLADIESHPQVVERYQALQEAVNVIGGRQIRNMATLAGNLCNGSPGADTPPPLIVLGARVEIAWKNGSGEIQRQTVSLEQFFTGPKKTVLEPGQLLTSVFIPDPPKSSGQAFRRLARVRLDVAKINCAVFLKRQGEKIVEARVAMGSVAATPVRAPSVEQALAGRKAGKVLFEKASAKVLEDILPITDIRSTEAYRRQVAPVLVREALEEAWSRAGGK